MKHLRTHFYSFGALIREKIQPASVDHRTQTSIDYPRYIISLGHRSHDSKKAICVSTKLKSVIRARLSHYFTTNASPPRTTFKGPQHELRSFFLEREAGSPLSVKYVSSITLEDIRWVTGSVTKATGSVVSMCDGLGIYTSTQSAAWDPITSC